MSEQAKTSDAWKPRMWIETKGKFYQAVGILQAEQTERLTQQEALDRIIAFFVENYDVAEKPEAS